MKQTAVEWLWEQIENKQPNLNWYKIFEHAKQKEREQIESAFSDGVNDECLGKNTTPEQYYETTFKK